MFGFLLQAAQLTREDVVQIVEATQEVSAMEIASQAVIIIVGVIGLPSFILFIAYVIRRMNSGEVRFAKIEGSIDSIQKDAQKSEKMYEQAIKALGHLDQRIDQQQILTAETRKDVKYMARRMDEFFTDARPGRGFTSKVKETIRETVKPDSLAKADRTVYPEMDGESEERPFTRVPSRPAVRSLRPHHDYGIAAATSEPIDLEPEVNLDADTDKVQPPPKPLMRRKAPEFRRRQS